MTTDKIEERIRSAYPDCEVAVLDSTGTQNHFDVRIMTQEFSGLTKIQQHKMVMQLFADELKSGEIHALAIKTVTKEK